MFISPPPPEPPWVEVVGYEAEPCAGRMARGEDHHEQQDESGQLHLVLHIHSVPE
jgi:hypothetical protein